ncbi:MAG TPA: hypothetical protein VEA19_04290 [Actinomycetota bacterium]|nr:hypothetical protein [Actinomycetota bacterium]
MPESSTSLPLSVRLLRPLSWLVLMISFAAATWLLVTSVESREVTRRIIGHASLTWQDEVRAVSWPKIIAGLGALAVGGSLAAGLRSIAWIATGGRR